MDEDGVKPDEVTMIGVVSARAQLEHLNLGMKFHQYVNENCIKMTVPLCNVLLDMYVKCGNIEAAERLFERMSKKTTSSTKYCVRPNLGLLR